MSLEVSKPWTWCWLDRTVRLGAKDVAGLELMLAGPTTTLLTIAVISTKHHPAAWSLPPKASMSL